MTSNIEDVVFYILYDIIGIIVAKIIWNKYADGNHCLHNNEIKSEHERLEYEAYEKIGGNYEKWY